MQGILSLNIRLLQRLFISYQNIEVIHIILDYRGYSYHIRLQRLSISYQIIDIIHIILDNRGYSYHITLQRLSILYQIIEVIHIILEYRDYPYHIKIQRYPYHIGILILFVSYQITKAVGKCHTLKIASQTVSVQVQPVPYQSQPGHDPHGYKKEQNILDWNLNNPSV